MSSILSFCVHHYRIAAWSAWAVSLIGRPETGFCLYSLIFTHIINSDVCCLVYYCITQTMLLHILCLSEPVSAYVTH